MHRTYFFLLFKGDPADNIYMEVEHRRLSFIKSSFSAHPAAEGELNPANASRYILSCILKLSNQPSIFFALHLNPICGGILELVILTA